MKITCPRPGCLSHTSLSLKKRSIVRNGFYFRKSESRRVVRFHCRSCGFYFSPATTRWDRYQKKRRMNLSIFRFYCSGMSQRRIAKILHLDRKTVVRKIRALAELKRREHEDFLLTLSQSHPLSKIQFDDLETSEHTKCKPLSVTLAVDPKSRKILKVKISSMPAKGLLAALSRRKYGFRPDERPQSWNQFMKELVPYVTPDCEWHSDENPHYPAPLRRHHPKAKHIAVKGGRGAITGQGELKKLRFDPLFQLNHTCAMLRANMNRLFRKTWCTTKNKRGLHDHLSLYIAYHNQQLTPFPCALKGGS